MSQFQKRGWTFVQVPAEVILDQRLSPIDARVYAYLLWRQGISENSFPGEERTAKDLGVSVKTIKRSVAQLVSCDWLRRKRRYGKSSMSWIFASPALCKAWDERQERDTSDPNDDTNGSPMTPSNGSPVTRHNDNQRTIVSNTGAPSAPVDETVTYRSIQKAFEQACGYPVNWGAGNSKAAKWLAQNHFTPEQVVGCYRHLKAQEFWKNKQLNLRNLPDQIGEYVQKHSPPAQGIDYNQYGYNAKGELVKIQ